MTYLTLFPVFIRRIVLYPILLVMTLLLPFHIAAENGIAELMGKSPEELLQSARDENKIKNNPDKTLLELTALVSAGEVKGLIEKSPAMYAEAYNKIGVIYASVYGNYSEAAEALLKGLDVARRNNLPYWKSRIGYNLTLMEHEQKVLTEEKDISGATIGTLKKIVANLDPTTESDITLAVIISLFELSVRYEKTTGIAESLRSYDVWEKLPFPCRTLVDGIAAYDSGNYDGAIDRIKLAADSLSVSNPSFAEDCLFFVPFVRGRRLLDEGKEREGLKEYSRLAEEALEKNDFFTSFETFRLLHRYCESKGYADLGRDYELQELRVKDRLISRSCSLSLEGSTAIYNERNLRHEILKQEAESKAYRTVIWVSVVFLIILSGLLLALWFKFRQVRLGKEVIVRNDREYFSRTPDIRSLKEVEGSKEGKVDGPKPLNKEEIVFDKVKKVLEENKEIFEDEFGASRLAELCGERQSVVSASILRVTGESTSQIIARARIREACRRINNPAEYGDYTIEAIGQSVGYRSRSHFGAVFKKIVGMAPSEYIEKVRGGSGT